MYISPNGHWRWIFAVLLLLVLALSIFEVVPVKNIDSWSTTSKQVQGRASLSTSNYTSTETEKLGLQRQGSSLRNNTIIVDVLSFGTLKRKELMQAQKETWASGVRAFYHVTEQEDRDPNCSDRYSLTQFIHLTRSCRRKHKKVPFLQQYVVMEAPYVINKPDPIGWYCGISRPGTGIGYMGRHYRENSIPDFVLFVDDDTTYDMNFFYERMRSEDPDRPRVWGGCLRIEYPELPHKFWLYGGSGSIWSRASIKRLIQPIHCNNTGSQFQHEVCSRLKDNLIYERGLWKDGMSVSDLMEAKFNQHPLCFYSDWLQSFFINYYYLSDIWNGDPLYQNQSESRIHVYESYKFGFEPPPPNRSQSYGRACTDAFGRAMCTPSSPICHNQNEKDMRSMWYRKQSN